MFESIWNFVKSVAHKVWNFAKSIVTPRLVEFVKTAMIGAFLGSMIAFVIICLGLAFGWLVLLVPVSTFLLLALKVTIKTVLEFAVYAVIAEFGLRFLEWVFAGKPMVSIEA